MHFLCLCIVLFVHKITFTTSLLVQLPHCCTAVPSSFLQSILSSGLVHSNAVHVGVAPAGPCYSVGTGALCGMAGHVYGEKLGGDLGFIV